MFIAQFYPVWDIGYKENINMTFSYLRDFTIKKWKHL